MLSISHAAGAQTVRGNVLAGRGLLAAVLVFVGAGVGCDRATPPPTRSMSQPSVADRPSSPSTQNPAPVFDGEIGRGSPDGVSFLGPFGVHVDTRHRLIVMDDLAHTAFVFEESGALAGRFGEQGDRPGQLLYPDGVTTDAAGNLYIADAGANRVQILGPPWTPLAEIRRWRVIGGQLANPRDVAIGRDGRLYVADWGNHAIRVFSDTRRHLLSIGGQGREPGQFVNPVSIALDADDRVYVSDQGNHRVQVFDHSGVFLRVVGERGAEPGQFNGPSGLVIDSDGRLFVADSGNRRVQIFSATGQVLTPITGGAEAPLDRPVDVAVSARRLYVSDAGRHTVQRFRR